jgi:hypothetical protein
MNNLYLGPGWGATGERLTNSVQQRGVLSDSSSPAMTGVMKERKRMEEENLLQKEGQH